MTQSDDLVAIALERYRLGVDDNSEPYAVPRYQSCIATTLRGRQSSLRAEMANAFYAAHGKVPTSNALADALKVIEGQCREAEPRHLHLRVARVAGDIHLDLGLSGSGQDHAFVWIRPDGTWRLTPIAPVLFRRTNLTSPMPIPVGAGDVRLLHRFVNLSKSNFRLLVAWLVAGFFEDIPHPVLVIGGPQGTGKSTLAQIAITLVDPSPAPLWAAPRSENDFAVTANGSYCIAYDNLSGLAGWQSDAFRRAVTGDGHVRRSLYTNGDVAVSYFRRIVILNGIDPGVVRGDLIDRSMFLELDPIASAQRRLDRDVRDEFRRAHAEILGALLDMTAMTLMTLPSTPLDAPPRMADFAQILAAVDQVKGWQTYDTYTKKIDDARIESIDSDRVAGAVVALMGHRDSWSSTASDLLEAVSRNPTPRDWPTTPAALSTRLRRAEPALESLGITVSRVRTSGQRTIEIKKEPIHPSSASYASATETSNVPTIDQAIANVQEMFPGAEVVG
jgi:hypothetical protein